MSVRSRFLSGGLLFTLLLGLLVGFTPAISAQAADARDFNPGNLISDAQFFNGQAMTAAEVQSFLNGKVASCQSGFTCLKDFKMNTVSRPADAGKCAAYDGRNNETAAQIIARVGQACGISQKAILVLLEKEQGLVTLRNPSASRFTIATGYACPDTSACDAKYFGFYNQVYMAALQFKRYQASPTSWGHIAGRVNNVRLHPAASCGSTQVFIQNQATAGLYNYTPYQPNKAALANLYGVGDSCSSYGNRNFWRLFTDWFGAATDPSALVRTASNSSVYLVSDTRKHLVSDMTLLNNLAPLGNVSIVDQAYLDRFTTAQPVGRIMRAASGAMYLFDNGLRFAFDSCDRVSDYGGACNPAGYVQLTDDQVAKFTSGPALTSVVGLTTGQRFYIKSAQRREVADAASQTQAGIPAGFTMLSASAIASLKLGTPVIRDSLVVQNRDNSSLSYLYGTSRYPVTTSALNALRNNLKPYGSLSNESLGKLTANSTAFAGRVKVAGTGPTQLLTSDGRVEWAADSNDGSLPSVPATAALIAGYPLQGTVPAGGGVKGANSPVISRAADGKIRAYDAWTGFLRLNGSSTFVTLPDKSLAMLSTGSSQLTVGGLYRTAGNPNVYLIDGPKSKILLKSFDPASAAGMSLKVAYVSDAELKAYTDSGTPLGYGYVCGTNAYVAAGGTLVPVPDRTLYPVAYNSLDASTCAVFSKSKTPAPKFIRTGDGRIYLLDGGRKRAVDTMARYIALGGPSIGFLSVSFDFVKTIPDGPLA
ncbi:hypothetical protein D9V32_07505 [Mycetocola tolaasinivorans]|uniref:Hemagglutinin n=1 Tax=Mycetocola tolaasinivorans TaxID=76635 RepID=A0A3L7A7E6_9MICO|nr:hypothetical protein [Mycetocola tolaasinivorans]RLP75995.1 hypothetical protein D9V32_07505 [Mycetocola tolaasinivorans]